MMEGKRIIALLPMKGNSQRVKNKNFRNFCGKPLFHWILETLMSIREIDEIIINTDAQNKIINSGLSDKTFEHVKLRERKKNLLGDQISMNLIIADDLINSDADLYLMTHATNPLLKSNTVRDALNFFISSNDVYDSLFTVDRIQARVYKCDGSPVNHDPNILIQTQDLDPCYVENSNLYIFSKKSFFNVNARIGKSPYMLEMDSMESVDIDTEDDWRHAEQLLSTC